MVAPFTITIEVKDTPLEDGFDGQSVMRLHASVNIKAHMKNSREKQCFLAKSKTLRNKLLQ